MKVLLEAGPYEGLNTTKYFDRIIALGNFHFEPYTWKKPIFDRNLTLFLNDPLFPKIMKIPLLKYWVKIWGIPSSQYCKRFWFSNCTGNFLILNSTYEISVYLTCIWYPFFERFTFAKNHKYISIYILVKNLGSIKVSILRKILIR